LILRIIFQQKKQHLGQAHRFREALCAAKLTLLNLSLGRQT